MRLHKKPGNGPGLTPVVTIGHELEHIGFSLLRLQPGESHAVAGSGVETCLIILTGTGDVSGPGFAYENIGGRQRVFDGRATAVYLPAGCAYRVQARSALAVAVATSPAPATGEPRLIRPDDVVVNERGKPGFRRQVHDILDLRTPAQRLVVGETTNHTGEWSSYPPHKHDEHIPGVEADMEEVYLFQVDPPGGFGVQVLYSSDGALDEAYTVRDGDVAILPFGYHPVAAAPGYRLYYLWIMAGQGRQLLPVDDPDHVWVKN